MPNLKELKNELRSLYNIPIHHRDWSKWSDWADIKKHTRSCSQEQANIIRACAAVKRSKNTVTYVEVFRLVEKSKTDESVLYPGIVNTDQQLILQDAYTVEEIRTFFSSFTGWCPSVDWVRKSVRKLKLPYSKYSLYKYETLIKLVELRISARKVKSETGKSNIRNLRNRHYAH